jgi:hypothetical protein
LGWVAIDQTVFPERYYSSEKSVSGGDDKTYSETVLQKSRTFPENGSTKVPEKKGRGVWKRGRKVMKEKQKSEESPKMKYQIEISTIPRLFHRRGWYLRNSKTLSQRELRRPWRNWEELCGGCEIAEEELRFASSEN